MARVAMMCDQCGQVDDHPKVHIGVVTKHHDCLSFAEKDHLLASFEATPGAVAKIIAAAEKGTHGDDLVAFIEKTHGGK